MGHSRNTDIDIDVESTDTEPSREELLARAARRPPRLTWESIVLAPTDPILGQKMEPYVAARRARLRRGVKVALGALVAFCLVASAASAFSSSEHASASTHASAKAAPMPAVVTIEKLDQTVRGKAPRHIVAAAPAPRAKRR